MRKNRSEWAASVNDRAIAHCHPIVNYGHRALAETPVATTLELPLGCWLEPDIPGPYGEPRNRIFGPTGKELHLRAPLSA